MSVRLCTAVLSTTCCCCALLFVCGSARADDGGGASPAVGQVRTLAVNPTDAVQLRALAHEGWIEASGQVLQTQSFDALYRVLGRAWTPSRVSATEFALPDLDETAPPSPNPFGVLDLGDLVSGGRQLASAQPSLLHFIYVGKDASAIAATTTSSTLASARR